MSQAQRAGGPHARRWVTITSRIPETERALIRLVAEQYSRRHGAQMTPSSLVRHLVMPQVLKEISLMVGASGPGPGELPPSQ